MVRCSRKQWVSTVGVAPSTCFRAITARSTAKPARYLPAKGLGERQVGRAASGEKNGTFISYRVDERFGEYAYNLEYVEQKNAIAVLPEPGADAHFNGKSYVSKNGLLTGERQHDRDPSHPPIHLSRY